MTNIERHSSLTENSPAVEYTQARRKGVKKFANSRVWPIVGAVLRCRGLSRLARVCVRAWHVRGVYFSGVRCICTTKNCVPRILICSKDRPSSGKRGAPPKESVRSCAHASMPAPSPFWRWISFFSLLPKFWINFNWYTKIWL